MTSARVAPGADVKHALLAFIHAPLYRKFEQVQ